MKSILINQAVEVDWLLSSSPGTAEVAADDKIQRVFDNLIPACEFAASMHREGHSAIRLIPESGPSLNVAQAIEITKKWESGQISDAAAHVEV